MIWNVLHFVGRHTHWNWLTRVAFMRLLGRALDKNLAKQMAQGDKKFKQMAKLGYKLATPEESVWHKPDARLPQWTTYDPRTGKISIHFESYETVKDILSGKKP